MTTVITAIIKTMYQIAWWVKVGCGMVDLSTRPEESLSE